MANNDQFLHRGLQVLAEEARPFVEHVLFKTYGAKWESRVLSDKTLNIRTLETNDPMAWLKVMRNQWNQAFERSLKPYREHTIRELLSLRHMYSHHDPLDDEDIRRGLDNIRGLLVDMQNERIERIDRLIAEFEESVGGKRSLRGSDGVSSADGPSVPSEAASAIDSLVFEHERMPSGRLIKGYLPDWHWSRAGGNYRVGRDFFWLEYEVHEPLLEVLVQVEAPNRETDPTLNQLKIGLIEQVAGIASEKYPSIRCELGTRASASNAARSKSTTVLKVTLVGDSMGSDWACAAEATIRVVHAVLGEFLSSAWERGTRLLP